MELSDAILAVMAERFDPEQLNPQRLVSMVDPDEAVELVGWSDEMQAWTVRRIPTELNRLAEPTIVTVESGRIVDPYMCLRVFSLFNGQRRMWRWETEPMSLDYLVPLKEAVEERLTR